MELRKKKKIEIHPNMLRHVTLSNRINMCHINKNNHIDGNFTNYTNHKYVKLEPNSHLLLIFCNTHQKHNVDKKQCKFITNANGKRILSLCITNTNSDKALHIFSNLTVLTIISFKNIHYKMVFIKKKYFLQENKTFTITLT